MNKCLSAAIPVTNHHMPQQNSPPKARVLFAAVWKQINVQNNKKDNSHVHFTLVITIGNLEIIAYRDFFTTIIAIQHVLEE